MAPDGKKHSNWGSLRLDGCGLQWMPLRWMWVAPSCEWQVNLLGILTQMSYRIKFKLLHIHISACKSVVSENRIDVARLRLLSDGST